jgi:N-acetylmuramoyl-L-alanine amidase
MKTIIISCAHGQEVWGKRSPDGKHREYKWSRDRAYEIGEKLATKGVEVVYIPDKGVDSEPGLWERVKKENEIDNAFVFSLHNNAAGNGKQWMGAMGAEIWTSRGQSKSDQYATKIMEFLKKQCPEIVYRFDTVRDGDVDKEENFTELMSKHPAVLLEWLFQDNKDDVVLLSDPSTNARFVYAIVDALFWIANN